MYRIMLYERIRFNVVDKAIANNKLQSNNLFEWLESVYAMNIHLECTLFMKIKTHNSITFWTGISWGSKL